jgi:hypothetical protein
MTPDHTPSKNVVAIHISTAGSMIESGLYFQSDREEMRRQRSARGLSITAVDELNLTSARSPQGFQLRNYASQAPEFLHISTAGSMIESGLYFQSDREEMRRQRSARGLSITAVDGMNLTSARSPQGFQLRNYASQAPEFRKSGT